jgi:hypothetical protein
MMVSEYSKHDRLGAHEDLIGIQRPLESIMKKSEGIYIREWCSG